MKKYTPLPIETNDIELSEELKMLTEQISKNTHEIWAKTRIQDGWTYGNERNDILKTHPCLVPYENLSEEEKEYDRQTAMEAIKVIVKLGFDISKK